MTVLFLLPGRRGRLLIAGVLLVAAFLTLAPMDAHAQREDLLLHQACRINPNSQDCICRDVHLYARVPKGKINWSHNPPTAAYGPDNEARVGTDPNLPPPPVFNLDLGIWEGGDETDFHQQDNNKFKAHCSQAYFQENLRRLIYILVAVAGGMFAATLAWGGFVHMQETATGESRSTARTVILRSFIGLVILAGAFIAWEAASGLFMDGFNIWENDAGVIDSF